MPPADFNSYGARRGNHQVMMRGTFANIRLRNEMAPGTEGSFTTYLPTGEVTSIFEAAERYREDGTPLAVLAGQGVRERVEPRLGGEGPQPAGRAVRDRRELRADPPLEPRGHGRAAAAVRGGGVSAASLGLTGAETLSVRGVGASDHAGAGRHRGGPSRGRHHVVVRGHRAGGRAGRGRVLRGRAASCGWCCARCWRVRARAARS